MGGLREEVIDDSKKKEEGGRPRRRSGADSAAGLIQDGVPLTKAAPSGGISGGDGGGGEAISPARQLVAAIDAATRASRDAPPGLGGQTIRTHESGGQLHFHADAEGLKAGVPVAEMWGAWRRLQHLDTFLYLDDANGTLLTLVTVLDRDPDTGGDRVHVVINLAPCKPTYSPAFEKLDKVIGR